ncbi:MAG TPA: MFS transporter [Phycisphaerae bacterium]|nr:MFS transporter [Phycisphaerae bacterium]
MVYFGMLGYLTIHFSSFIFQGVEGADDYSHKMVGILTAGITLAMVFLGFVADKWGVRKALIGAFLFMLVGRVLISGAPTVFGLQPAGLWSSLHLVTMAGILLVIIGYGMYQPAAYAGVRKFTTPKTATMAFAMLYALMNLGAWFPTFAFLLRDEDFLNLGIPGTFWIYTGFTIVALLATVFILSRKTVERAIATAKEETAKLKEAEAQKEKDKPGEPKSPQTAPAEPEVTQAARVPLHFWGMLVAILVALYFTVPDPWRYVLGGVIIVASLVGVVIPSARHWLARHPLSDGKFFFFIFALIPVQTLFTYNWFVLPQYISRTYEGWIGNYFEIFSNMNPLLIFIFAPIIAAITYKRKVYNMMIVGTLIMAVPAFLPAIGPSFWTLSGYVVLMTVGEAMWSPRFLQYAAEIAPEGRTGMYMGVAQLPWFLTKVLVPLLYSGKVMAHYCPEEGPKDTETMWLVFGCIAICSTILLILAKPWVGKDFKTKAD